MIQCILIGKRLQKNIQALKSFPININTDLNICGIVAGMSPVDAYGMKMQL